MTNLPQTPESAPEALPKPVLTPSQAKRANQTVKGMFISVLLTVIIAVVVIALNPASKTDGYRPDINVSVTAQEAAAAADFTPLAPAVPEGWYANFARWISAGVDGIAYWEIGYVTPEQKFVWFRQTADANAVWLAQITDSAAITGTTEIGGATWEVRTKGKDTTYILKRGRSTVLLSSKSGTNVLEEMAAIVAAGLPAAG
ncbi:DUF4245 domain-containing protein [Paeniglutamicibacter cryotolerans]|uniref:DUF4245 domain-containing protein n=1 Tax=Paeniglutamicibacter cryotolerans TaxID=670079 RepID=A0A839QJB6_9MICC|nr:DUF4245 domain-containing protein [Paeniglutamicibacter cryotolerans]MBB2995940.1 hypothetical protein [Paeniglutamicibacter cryotolerans]